MLIDLVSDSEWKALGTPGTFATGSDDVSAAINLSEHVASFALANWKRATTFYHIQTNTGGVTVTLLPQTAPASGGPWTDVPAATIPRVSGVPTAGQFLIHAFDREALPNDKWVRFIARHAGGTSVVKGGIILLTRLDRKVNQAVVDAGLVTRHYL